MTKEEFLNCPEDQRKKFNKPLNLVSKFMTPKGQDSSIYKEKLLNSIDGFNCIIDEDNDYICYGDCQLRGKTEYNYKNPFIKGFHKISNKMNDTTLFTMTVTTNEGKKIPSYIKLYTANHEINHADTFLYKAANEKKTCLYYGLTKVMFLPFGKSILVGRQLNESINEIYNQYQLYLDNPKIFKHTKSLDELIYSIPPYFNGGVCYYDIGYVAKLFLIVCDNDLTVPYGSLLDNDEILVNKTVDLNGHRVIKNDLLYAGKYNCMEFEKHFNELCGGKGRYNLICLAYDILFDEAKKNEDVNSILSSILTMIDKYKTEKYKRMEELGLWDKEKREYHERIYSEYKNFIESSTTTEKKQKNTKVLKKSLKKNIKEAIKEADK